MAEDTISTKQYLLDHVLYEMEMYLYTYHLLHTAMFPELLDFNTVWNSHNVALRNLMSFFGISGQAGKDEIVYNSFSFAEQPSNRKKRQEFYSPISKAINHISIQRFLGYNGERLDDVVIRARETVFPEIQEYIRRFIRHLETDAAITYTYSLDNKECTVDIKNELLDDRVAGMIAKVKQLDSMCSRHGSRLSKTVTTE
jgi:hypothetical protein